MDVHLVDGTYELFRAYYGAPQALGADGQEVGALRALGRSLLRLVREDDATHIAVAFDHVIESFRNRLYDGYKTGDGIDPALWSQFEPAERLARALGFVVWPMEEFEADDALATAAARYASDTRVGRIHICSPDKDLTQCVRGDRIVSVDRRRRKVMDENQVIEKFGVGPQSIPDWLALVGDSADGIPGIPRWGARSAASVLAIYGKIEHIPPNPEDWDAPVRGAKSLASNLAHNYDAALLYRQLATLRNDVPLDEGVDDIRYPGANKTDLIQLTEWMDDGGMFDRVPFFQD